MRKNFVDVLKAHSDVDLKKEYNKIFNMYYYSLRINDTVERHFLNLPFRQPFLNLNEFNIRNGFDFKNKYSLTTDEMISFIEYAYNMSIWFIGDNSDIAFFIQHIDWVMDGIGYIAINQDEFFTIFAPKDSAAIAVAEIPTLPDDVSYKIISYNHHSMSGDIDGKRETLLKLADLLEPKRGKLKEINSRVNDTLFELFNSCNIRHNNIDPESKKYKKYIAEMSKEDLEHTYDEIYQMCLFAFMELENHERKTWALELKKAINDSSHS